MKHIKSYKIFESFQLPDGVSAETIIEICYEITDDEKFICDISKSRRLGYFIDIIRKDNYNYSGFKLSEISDCVLRLRTYLGNDFKKCSVRYVGDYDSNKINLDNLEINSNYYDDKNIEELFIYIKNETYKKL